MARWSSAPPDDASPYAVNVKGDRRGPEPFEFIEPGDDAGVVAPDEAATGGRPGWVDAAAVALAVAIGAWALSAIAGGPDPQESSPSTSAAPPLSVTVPVAPVIERGVQSSAAGERLGDRRVLVVVSDRAGNENRLVSVGTEASEVSELPPFDNFTFDASGRWMAATSISRLSQLQRVLWVAPVGGFFEPVAIDVRGFAWHDDDPGRIAWTSEERTVLSFLELEGEPNIVEVDGVELPVRGALRGWGSWGYSVQTSYRRSASAIVDPSGKLIADEVSGVYAGQWHDGRLVFSGGGSASTFIDVAGWQAEPVPGLDDDDYVWTLAASQGRTAILVGDGGVRAPFAGSVIRSEGDDSSVTAQASAYSQLAWVGDSIVFAEQEAFVGDSSTAAQLTLLTADDERIELALPDLFGGRLWISSIAVPFHEDP